MPGCHGNLGFSYRSGRGTSSNWGDTVLASLRNSLSLTALFGSVLCASTWAYGPQSAPSTDWKEIYATEDGKLSKDSGSPEKENQFFYQGAQFIHQIQKGAQPANGGVVKRAFHAKQHLGSQATFTVAPDLPPWAQIGLWSQPGKEYAAYVRWSNGQVVMAPDPKGDVRGMAVKIMNTPGINLVGEPHGDTSQDFLCINGPGMPVKDIFQFMSLIRAVTQGGNVPKTLAQSIGLIEAGKVLKAVAVSQLHKVKSLTSETYTAAAPIAFGPYAAKIQLTPTRKPQGKKGDHPDYLKHDLIARLGVGDIVFHLDAQFYVSESKTPIENARATWKPRHAPFVRLGTLTIPRRTAIEESDAENQNTFVERLTFTPWHASALHRPLGSIMRARRLAYQSSQEGRGARR